MEIRDLRADDLEQAWALDADAFHSPAERRELFLRWNEPAHFKGAFAGGRLVALAGAYPFGQYFSGRSVPMGGLTSVAVAPAERGGGLARRVVGEVLEGMRASGAAISTLFPATTRLYRDLGWEVAGSHCYRALSPRSLAGLPRPEGGVSVRAAAVDEIERMRACYEGVAPQINGYVDRPDFIWGRNRDLWRKRSLFLAESGSGETLGYLVYRQLDGEYSGIGGPFRIALDELVASEPNAALALWRLLGSWATQVEKIFYRASPEDPLLLWLPEQDFGGLAEVRWMTRMVDAEAAVAARGFPPGLEVEAHLELRDPLLPANEGRFVLGVSKGRGRLESGGTGSLRLDVGAFSALFTGWAGCALLRRAGRLHGAAAADCAALDAAFAGPTPWMLDEF